MRTRLLIAPVLLAVACSTTSSSEPASKPVPAEATKAARKPRGAAAYAGERTRVVADLGSAKDASLTDEHGASRSLASFWSAGYAVVVFYRGHW